MLDTLEGPNLKQNCGPDLDSTAYDSREKPLNLICFMVVLSHYLARNMYYRNMDFVEFTFNHSYLMKQDPSSNRVSFSLRVWQVSSQLAERYKNQPHAATAHLVIQIEIDRNLISTARCEQYRHSVESTPLLKHGHLLLLLQFLQNLIEHTLNFHILNPKSSTQ